MPCGNSVKPFCEKYFVTPLSSAQNSSRSLRRIISLYATLEISRNNKGPNPNRIRAFAFRISDLSNLIFQKGASTVRNLTVRVPDEVYKAARVYANRYHSSISSVVADFLFTLRHLSDSGDLMRPSAAIDFHRELLRVNKVGRANLEPLNDKEFLAVARYILSSEN
jgi:hypothetical protein